MENCRVEKDRIVYLDVLRAVACICVVMIHATSEFIDFNSDTFSFFVEVSLNAISRIAVPLFVMVSGALFLDDNYKYSNKKMVSHIRKLIVFFAFWSIIYVTIGYFNYLNNYDYKMTKTQIIMDLVNGNYHMWFIYMIIGLYLLTPILRLWIKKENKNYIQYFLLLCFIFSFLFPQISEYGTYYHNIFVLFQTVPNTIELSSVSGYVSYFVLGWYLHNYATKINYKTMILGIISMIASVVGTYVLSVKAGVVVTMYNNLSVNVLLTTIMFFCLVKYVFSTTAHENKGLKTVFFISKYSLGIYAIHAIFDNYFYLKSFQWQMGIIPKSMCVFICTMTMSVLSTYFIAQIPFLKNMVM